VVTFNLDEMDQSSSTSLPFLQRHSKDVQPLPSRQPNAKVQTSRIPVRKKGTPSKQAAAGDYQTGTLSKLAAVGGYQGNDPPSRRMPVIPTVENISPAYHATEEEVSLPRRAASPPVPALAKKMRQEGLLEEPLPSKSKKSDLHIATADRYRGTVPETRTEKFPPIMPTPPASEESIAPASRKKMNERRCDAHPGKKKVDDHSVRLPPLLPPSNGHEPQGRGVVLQQLSQLRKVSI
jgi:hypothetical protein